MTDPSPLDPAAWLAAIVTSSEDAIVSKTVEGQITSWNGAAERLYGYRADEAIGRSIHIIVPEFLAEEEYEILRTIARGERVEHYETQRRTKDGRLIAVSLTISPVRDASGTVVGASKIARDITERREQERRLREANQRKDEFLAMLGHELRNPLSPVQTAADVLARHTRADPVAQQLCGVIDRQVRQMVRLIDDLLEVSRITQGRVELRMAVFDLRGAVSQAVEAMGALIASRAHRLSLVLPGLPVWVNGDAQRLVQAISNVLHNACKYTPEGGRIEVELSERDGRAVLQVDDNGLGIAPALLPHLFDLFVQGERTIDRAEGGLGIGLTLVRSILERHAGDVTADSAGPGEGSRFTLRLPTAAAPAAASPAQNSPALAAAAAPRRVVVVEDNLEAARMLTQFVQILGHRAEALADPYAAEAAILAGSPDLVLMDIGLPGLSGYELTERLRAAGYAGVVIAVSGYGSEADRARSRAAGFDQHWIKPVDPRLLEQVLAGSLTDQATWRAPAIAAESKAV